MLYRVTVSIEKKNHILKRKCEDLKKDFAEIDLNQNCLVSYISNLDEQIKVLQNEKCMLEENIDSFLKEKEIQIYEMGITMITFVMSMRTFSS